ncbi:hypothetical protein EX30DRAFT_339252 [Ascodesmis nigricans]|uniref:Small ribosomal subunit protein uS9m n=1 Tax=Ascodesmis nigricans TaxID=341454 RepID=A0A4S2N1Q5_9PEZI|nr:hypothetical protein EX30DRAFT_339252 [Ascodesmis nigricans]
MVAGLVSLRHCCRTILGEAFNTRVALPRASFPHPRPLAGARSFTISHVQQARSILDDEGEVNDDWILKTGTGTSGQGPVNIADELTEEDITPTWAEQQFAVRRVPVSASYFTGNATFVDNLLALRALQRKYELLPTIPKDQVPPVKWKTLVEYNALAGKSVSASKFKQLTNILDRLNIIEPTLMPQDVQDVLAWYKRDTQGAVSTQKERTVDEFGRGYGLGRRKTSVARVYVLEGDGQVYINGKTLAEHFERLHDRESAIWPLLVTDRIDKYNVWATVDGGGKTGQAEALTLGVARALMVHEPALKPALRRAGCVTRDHRMVERKKPGHVKARKMPTWVKR